jgi:hypothetical protein
MELDLIDGVAPTHADRKETSWRTSNANRETIPRINIPNKTNRTLTNAIEATDPMRRISINTIVIRVNKLKGSVSAARLRRSKAKGSQTKEAQGARI